MALPTTNFKAKIKLLPKQREFIKKPNNDVKLDICVYQGGYGSGKTWSGSLKGLLLCRKHPGIRGLACAKTYPLLRDTTLQTYFEHFDNFGWIAGKHFIWRASEQKLIFPQWGNSEILFRHLEQPFKLKSLNLGWVHMEEMSECEESVFLMLLSRLRQGGLQTRYLFGTTNPQASKGWIWEYFVERNQSQDGDVVYRRVLAPSTENIHLPTEYLENMRNQFDEQYYRINVLGMDGDYTAGLVCYSFSDLNIRETPYRPELDIYLSCDFNVDPMSWVCLHRFNNEVHQFDEIVIENTNINECVDEFCRRYPAHQAKVILNGDASGNNRDVRAPDVGGTSFTQMENRFRELRYKARVVKDVRQKNPPVADRVAAMNALICNSEGVRRYFVDPRCKWTIKNMYNLKYKDGTGIIDEPTQNDIKQDPKQKFVKHVYDGVSYHAEKYDPVVLKVKKKGPGIVDHNLGFAV